MSNQHLFAVYSLDFFQAYADKKTAFSVTDPILIHRLQHVLRLQQTDMVICFNDVVHAQCTVEKYEKKAVRLSYRSVEKNRMIAPDLTLILPLLKREALDEVIYACRELGVTRVQLVATEKSSRQNITAQELERLERVSIAAAEQSKNFSPCRIVADPKGVPTLLHLLQEGAFADAYKLYADGSGITGLQALVGMPDTQKSIVICVGPEGDMTDTERQALQKAGFTFVTLGSTVLRACQAAVLMIGMMRAFR